MEVMPKRKGKIDFRAPATKGDVDELAQLTDKNFRRVDKRFDGIDRRFDGMASQEEIAKLHTKIDNLEKNREQDKQDIIREFRSSVELQKADLEGAHQDELAAVEGRKDAPLAWKSMPRRLLKVELDVEKIKDRLEIS